jgi:hypothetical protein
LPSQIPAPISWSTSIEFINHLNQSVK